MKLPGVALQAATESLRGLAERVNRAALSEMTDELLWNQQFGR